MKKTLLISGVLLALTATVASAAGINLSWTDCGTNGQLNRNFACNITGNPPNVLIASYDPPTGLTKVSGINTIMDLQTLSPIGATSWWDLFNSGSCRSAVPFANISFPFTCNDYFQGGGSGGITAYIPTGTNRRRLGGSWSQGEANLGPVPAGTETYALQIVISNALTTTCNAGCSEAACIVFNDLLISQPIGEPIGSPSLGNALGRNWVTWQGGAIAAPGCPQATPTINRTWGQVKSIYR